MAWRDRVIRCQHSLGARAGRDRARKGRRKAHTSATDVVICVPPEAPTTICTLPSLSTRMEGHMDESGCLPMIRRRRQRCRSAAWLRYWPPPKSDPVSEASHPAPGLMKLAGEGNTPNWLTKLGELKSSISSLNRMPLTLESTLEPKLKRGRLR